MDSKSVNDLDTCAITLACYSPDELLERVRFLFSKIDPSHSLKKNRKFRFLGSLGKYYWNNRTFPSHELSYERALLHLLPRTKTRFSEKDCGGLYFLDLKFQLALPRYSRTRFPFVQPRENTSDLELLAYFLHGGFVFAVVAEENVEVLGFYLALEDR